MISSLKSVFGLLLLLLFIYSKQVYTEPIPSTSLEETESDLVVTLKQPFSSKLKGRYLRSFHGKKYYAFQGIPYAIPPINERRFKESEPVEQWEGIKDTTINTKVCPQFDDNQEFIGDEDCLVLNVYTPVNCKNITSLIPVLFWIHGGLFESGSGSYQEYNPAYFMDEDIVVVTINYRLGVLGFLSTEDNAMPTNLGLKDQRLALEWTYANIERFGGNPENIVLMGQSVGGVSVGYHLTNYEKPFITGAIFASGTSLFPGYQANPRQRAFEAGKKLDSSFNSTNSFDLLKLLQNVTAKAVTLAGSYGQQSTLSDSWVSVIPNDHRYLLLPTDSMEKGQFTRVPLLLGFNSEEALKFLPDVQTAANQARQLDKHPTDMLGILEVGQNNATEVALELKQVYTNSSFSEDLPALVRYTSDFYINMPVLKYAESASRFVAVYLYEFSFESSNTATHNIPGIDGNQHADDIPYYWYQRDMHGDEELTSSRFVEILTNFIKYKEPMPSASLFFGNITWPRFDPTDLKYVNFSRHLNVQSNPRKYRSVKKILDKYLTKPIMFY